MLDIQKIQTEIIERLKPLDPEKIILFGSYAYGAPAEDSDIDLFLVNRESSGDPASYQLNARLRLRDLIYKYKIGFDVFCASQAFLESREDYFYKVDILQKGKVIYAQ